MTHGGFPSLARLSWRGTKCSPVTRSLTPHIAGCYSVRPENYYALPSPASLLAIFEPHAQSAPPFCARRALAWWSWLPCLVRAPLWTAFAPCRPGHLHWESACNCGHTPSLVTVGRSRLVGGWVGWRSPPACSYKTPTSGHLFGHGGLGWSLSSSALSWRCEETVQFVSEGGEGDFRFVSVGTGGGRAMTSLAEVFEYSRDTSNIVSTYSEAEGGYPYNDQVSIAVSVDLTDARQRRLESHFNRQRGFESCECNRARNVVTILHLGGLRGDAVIRYIRHRVDPNATEVAN